MLMFDPSHQKSNSTWFFIPLYIISFLCHISRLRCRTEKITRSILSILINRDRISIRCAREIRNKFIPYLYDYTTVSISDGPCLYKTQSRFSTPVYWFLKRFKPLKSIFFSNKCVLRIFMEIWRILNNRDV